MKKSSILAVATAICIIVSIVSSVNGNSIRGSSPEDESKKKGWKAGMISGIVLSIIFAGLTYMAMGAEYKSSQF